MQFIEGMVVRSQAGHDQNRFYILVAISGEYGFIADGKRRKIEKPKKKNLRHLKRTAAVLPPQEYDTNQKLRRVLWSYNEAASPAVH